jgi:class 3 adenylate cyclase
VDEKIPDPSPVNVKPLAEQPSTEDSSPEDWSPSKAAQFCTDYRFPDLIPNDHAALHLTPEMIALLNSDAAAKGLSKGLLSPFMFGGGSGTKSALVRALIDSKPREDLEAEITQLRAKVKEQAQKTIEQQKGSEAERSARRSLEEELKRLKGIEDARHLLDRVRPSAHRLLSQGGELRKQFEEDKPCTAFVMSIDIRRSTELMLKAREPKRFADFITGLCSTLGGIIIDNYGVFDKFTGDGVLAFFPDFYCGNDGGYRAVKVADEAHRAFTEHYSRNRNCFTSVLKETGLGIGVDYGTVQLVRIRDQLTVVGTPVVYACRMGGASAGQTLLNQPAYEHIFERFSAYCNFEETEIEFKHEGKTVAYRVSLNEKAFRLAIPAWEATAIMPDAKVVKE